MVYWGLQASASLFHPYLLSSEPGSWSVCGSVLAATTQSLWEGPFQALLPENAKDCTWDFSLQTLCSAAFSKGREASRGLMIHLFPFSFHCLFPAMPWPCRSRMHTPLIRSITRDVQTFWTGSSALDTGKRRSGDIPSLPAPLHLLRTAVFYLSLSGVFEIQRINIDLSLCQNSPAELERPGTDLLKGVF